ncbi:WxL domain-containing protein [Furfurilactobacillus entadae]|uniref:hypothetical protein n=1 Tax=Furfurilactobacillus entadae TaxID=2922307 RepID=UPI0035E676A0
MKQKQFTLLTDQVLFGLLSCLFIFWWCAPLPAHADDANNFVDVTSTMNIVNQRAYVAGQSPTTNPLGQIKYPTINKVLANYTVNGQISTRTDTLKVQLTGKFSTGNSTSVPAQFYLLNSLYFGSFSNNTFNDDGDDLLGYFNIQPNYTNNLIFTNLMVAVPLFSQSQPPYYIGFQATTALRPNNPDYFALATWAKPASYSLKPTINQPVKDTDTTISGTGSFAGDTIRCDATNTTTTVDGNGRYTLPVGTSLRGKSQVTVTESSTKGDTPGTAQASVQSDDLEIESDTQTVTFNPDEMLALSQKSDDDIISALVKAAGISASDSSGPARNNISFDTEGTSLGAKLAALIPNGQLTVPIYATNGTDNSEPLYITVVCVPGTLSFEALPATYTFPTSTVPITPINKAPAAAPIDISDTREPGAKWTLTASATPMKNAAGVKLPGGFVDANNGSITPLSSAATIVANGTKAAGHSLTNAAADWSATNGLLLHVDPGALAGQYTGSINWSLTNAPD